MQDNVEANKLHKRKRDPLTEPCGTYALLQLIGGTSGAGIELQPVATHAPSDFLP
jgi:hypothetical protein